MHVMKMSDELFDLMEMMLAYHESYEGDFRSFNDRFNFELRYWFHLSELKKMIEEEFERIKPFDNKNY